MRSLRTCLRWVVVIVCLLAFAGRRVGEPAHAAGPLPQQAYVWQRAWTPAVRAAVGDSAGDFSRHVVLAAEVSFRSGAFEVARVAPDYPCLSHQQGRVGVALRIGPYNGSFADAETIARLQALARSIMDEALAAGTRPAELQIDFDCAERRLDGYLRWVRAIKQSIGSTPLTITALPSWLKHASFTTLAGATDGYVLQVHSLERPASADQPMTLCDPAAAREAVALAGRMGVPFRVALPTYGYWVAFDDAGRFVGLSAEGPSATWPLHARVAELRAEPDAMAALVSGWAARRPACMTGIIWYRLPVIGDTLNWRMATLRAVMNGQSPRPRLQAVARESAPGLFDIELFNGGAADAPLAWAAVMVDCPADIVAHDALGGFELGSAPGQRWVLRPAGASRDERLAPGDRRAIGWVRVRGDKEVVHVSIDHP